MKVIILSGIPGSGKSTYAKENFPDARIYSADQFFMNGSTYKYVPEDIGVAHADCLFRFVCRITGKWLRDFTGTIVVDNTNTTVAEIAPYYEVAAAFGHDVEIRTLQHYMDPTIAAKRNVHGVPLEVCGKLRSQLVTRELPAWWKHSFIIVSSELA